MNTFLCAECGSVFASKFSMRRHTENIHSKISFECQICKKSFSRLAYLKSHVFRHHVNYPKEMHSTVLLETVRSKSEAQSSASTSAASSSPSTLDTSGKSKRANDSGIAGPNVVHPRLSTEHSLLVSRNQDYVLETDSIISMSNIGDTASQETPFNAWGATEEPKIQTDLTSDLPSVSSFIKSEFMSEVDSLSSQEMSRCTEENTLLPTNPAPVEQSVSQQKDDEIDLFFRSIAMSVKKLRPDLIHEAKMSSLEMIFRLESRQRNNE